MNSVSGLSGLSRRRLLQLGGLTAVSAATGGSLLAGCSTSGAGGGGANTLKFWDMPWGTATYSQEAQAITEAYVGVDGSKVEYQTVQWANFSQTFASAVASGTNPAISTGGGFQPYLLASEGALHFADGALKKLQDRGITDFLPGLVEQGKIEGGHVGVPWSTETSVLHYTRSLHDQLGLRAPETWDEVVENGKVFRSKLNLPYMIAGAGPGNVTGPHTVINMMLNNGGGLFDEANLLDVLNDRNVEAVEFLMRLSRDRILDPSGVNYTQDNVAQIFKDKRAGFAYERCQFGGVLVGDKDIEVAFPMKGPHGDQGSIQFVNFLMMYKNNNPSVERTEDFLVDYVENLPRFWQKGVVAGIPARQSIAALPEVGADEDIQAVLKSWLSVVKPLSWRTTYGFPALAAYDSSDPFTRLAQTVISGQGDARAALQRFEEELLRIADPSKP